MKPELSQKIQQRINKISVSAFHEEFQRLREKYKSREMPKLRRKPYYTMGDYSQFKHFNVKKAMDHFGIIEVPWEDPDSSMGTCIIGAPVISLCPRLEHYVPIMLHEIGHALMTKRQITNVEKLNEETKANLFSVYAMEEMGVIIKPHWPVNLLEDHLDTYTFSPRVNIEMIKRKARQFVEKGI